MFDQVLDTPLEISQKNQKNSSEFGKFLIFSVNDGISDQNTVQVLN